MEQVKVMHEASQIAYNASTTLQTNVQVSKIPTEIFECRFISDHPRGVPSYRTQEIFNSALFESVGACRVHPLGVVPKTTVGYW